MTRLQKYILILMLGPFLSITIGLSLLALITQSLTQLDLLIERGQSPFTILSISVLATPQFMAIVAPVALFTTVAMVYGRLYSENEIVVAFAGGKSIWNIAEPAVRLASIVALFVLFINVFVQPVTYHIMREKLFAIRSDIVTTLVKEGQFREPIKGLTVYTRKIAPNGQMMGLLISDSRNPQTIVTFSAQTGGPIKIKGFPAFSLNNGVVHKRMANGVTEVVGFSQYIMELTGFDTGEAEVFFKPGDRFTHQLFAPDKTSYWDRANYGKLTSEAHRRFSSPLNSIAAALLGLNAILGSAFSRRGYGLQIFKMAGIALIMLLFQAGIKGVLDDAPNLNFLQYIAPIAVIIWVSKSLGFWKDYSQKALGNSLKKHNNKRAQNAI